ncbi:hypothetical protein CI807_07160 [Pseudomonas sp. NS1(2017)]|nr:hypothetical protein CI807_07160 [Pseudomonas sp. NS1(2017)]
MRKIDVDAVYKSFQLSFLTPFKYVVIYSVAVLYGDTWPIPVRYSRECLVQLAYSRRMELLTRIFNSVLGIVFCLRE